MSRLAIPDHLRASQTKASDPTLSVWVSANAGSGKTHVLTQRVIRLLLTGIPPAKILCLTFTKAAAAQMATRVFATLSEWTRLSDPELRAAISETGAPAPTPADLVLARRLFTRTIETPGGLKIQTIHAFCERLLHLFPFEANVPARFEVADELRTQEMLALAKRATIEAAQRSAGALGAALTLVADLAGAFGIDRLVGEAMARRAGARRGTDLQSALQVRLGGHFASVEMVRRAMVHDGLPPSRWDATAELLETGLKSDGEQAARLRAALNALAGAADLIQALAGYLPVFFTAKGEVKKTLITSALGKAHPDVKAALEGEQLRLVSLIDELRIAESIERTTALLALVDDVFTRYEHVKNAHGLLDFDDLIDRTLALLQSTGSGWVLHKLDAGIDHVLVDEAQDTSETQWKILEHLTGDFASGSGARPRARSFFVVGDDKQSIFSFQGAAPLMFDQMRGAFERRFRSGAKPFERVALKTSFRSVPVILAAIDAVFDMAAHQDGLVQPHDIWPTHESLKSQLPGLIEIWPRIKADATPDPADWSIPIDVPSERDPPSIVADRVARKIALLLSPTSGEYVHDGRGGQKRPVRAGDILILVRTRNAFFEAVIRALKRYQVPLAGADRLDVANHIAVMDLVAVGRTALLPQDDLSLACVLKAPFFGFSDDDLIALAPGRRGALFETLSASADPRYRAASETIRRWGTTAALTTPFAFYVELLGRDGGRRQMEARLGPEAHDAIDEFLRLALAHEKLGAPSLGSFLADVEALDSSIKRDMEASGDAVRVMTVHAAKGLEAKIVFLPDTCGVPAPIFDPVVFDLNKETGNAPVLVWSPRKGDDPLVVAAARTAARQATMREYRRLLYVALTRAEERLYVAGFFQAKEPPPDCWNAMILDTFRDREGVETPAFWSETDVVLRVTTGGSGDDALSAGEPAAQRAFGLAPEWLFRPAPLAVAPSTALRPSRREGGDATSAARRRSISYGLAVHELLQHLPSCEAGARADAGRAFLNARGTAYHPDIHERVLAEALAVMAAPQLEVLFRPGARAEVAVAGRLLGRGGLTYDVNGVVDRLAVTPRGVIAADFKTGRPTRDVPPAYATQLALYRRVLMPLWPGYPLRMLLVWTTGPTVVELDPAALDEAADAALGLP